MIQSDNHQSNKRPGRPMHIGRIIVDPKRGSAIGVYIGVCSHCNHKLIISRTEAEVLAAAYVRDRSRYLVRLINYLLGIRRI